MAEEDNLENAAAPASLVGRLVIRMEMAMEKEKMDIIALVKNPDICDALLQELNAIAIDIDSYEYGLPLYDEGARARLREAIYKWAVKGV